MKILFVAHKKNRHTDERELYEMDLMNEVLGFRRSLLDLGLLTVAACTPSEHEVVIRDEYVEPLDFDEDCDLVALSAKTSCAPAAYEVAARFRARGKTVVLGGIHASLLPEEALEHVDYIVTGEAEEAWPRFLREFAAGRAERRTDAGAFPPMDAIPPPSFRGLDPGDFLFHQIQTTRGCPFRCRFCSVPDISGQAFRFKPVGTVLDELAAMPRVGRLRERMKAVYFVDDNFISRTKYTRELLEALAVERRRGRVPDWSAETTLNVSRDEELLDLFREAGCTTLIIGFESISEETLKSMDKGINFCLTYPEAIERIHRRGISIVGNFIVGFDTDHPSVFRDTRDFIFEHNILYPFFSILAPMPGTELHEEFKAAGRLDTFDWSRYDTRHVIFEPRHMTREQLMDGYIWLFEQCYTSERALANLERFWARPERSGSSWIERTFVRYRVARSRSITPLGRAFFRRALGAMTRPGAKGDMAQLLYYLDSGHFAESLVPHKSADYAEHARGFEAGVLAGPAASGAAKQWEAQRFAQAVG